MSADLNRLKSTPLPSKELTGSVLLVDDEEPNRALLRDLLEARGCEVREAETGAQALCSVAERPPDLILLDVMMPGMDGFEVCRRLKQDPCTAPIPILMVTALSDRQERLAGIEAGANDFLNKPVDLQDLALRVTNSFYTKQLYDRLKAEQQRSEQLLLNILPPSVAARMKHGETTIADQHPEASVLVADLAGFTALLGQVNPHQIVFLLNEIFSGFDELVERFGLEKIRTVGDAYIAAGGIHTTVAQPTETLAELACQMQVAVLAVNAQYNTSFRLRIGLSTGSVISGVIGRQRFAYDLWGEAVNLACHLKAAALPGGILVDEPTFCRLEHAYRFSGPCTLELPHQGRVSVRTLAPGVNLPPGPPPAARSPAPPLVPGSQARVRNEVAT